MEHHATIWLVFMKDLRLDLRLRALGDVQVCCGVIRGNFFLLTIHIWRLVNSLEVGHHGYC